MRISRIPLANFPRLAAIGPRLLLGLEEAESTSEEEKEQASIAQRQARTAKRRTNRGSLPAHLPRIEMIVDIDDHVCPGCQNDLVAGKIKLSKVDPQNGQAFISYDIPVDKFDFKKTGNNYEVMYLKGVDALIQDNKM